MQASSSKNPQVTRLEHTPDRHLCRESWTLGNWVSAWRIEHVDDEPVLTLSERARLKELEREVRELRMENEFLGKATAFFAKKSQ
jgi:transposase-like protein